MWAFTKSAITEESEIQKRTNGDTSVANILQTLLNRRLDFELSSDEWGKMCKMFHPLFPAYLRHCANADYLPILLREFNWNTENENLPVVIGMDFTPDGWEGVLIWENQNGAGTSVRHNPTEQWGEWRECVDFVLNTLHGNEKNLMGIYNEGELMGVLYECKSDDDEDD